MRQTQPQITAALRPRFSARSKGIIVGGIPQNLANGKVFTTSTLQTVVGPIGRSFQNTTFGAIGVCDDFIPSGGSATLIFQAYKAGSGSDLGNALFSNNQTNASDFNLYLPYSDGKLYFRWGGETNGSTALEIASLSYAPSDVFVLTVGPRGMEAWQNGRLVGSNGATPSRAANSAYSLYVGGVATVWTKWNVGLYVGLTGQSSVSECAQLSRNPWQVFADNQPIFAAWPDSAGTAYTLSCATTSFSVGYNSAALTKGLNLKGSATAYTVGYNSASITKALNLTAASTAYAVGYNSAALTKAWKLACAATSYTVGYNSAALTRGWALQATTTAYAVGYNAANITTTAHSAYALACATTAYVVNGNASTVGFVTTNTGAGSKKRHKRRKVEIDGRIYDVPERDLPALLEAVMLKRRPPSTVEAEEPAQEEAVEAQEAVYQATWVMPSLDEAQARYDAMLAQFNAQAQADVAKLLAKVAERVIADLEDEEEAVSLLLMH